MLSTDIDVGGTRAGVRGNPVHMACHAEWRLRHPEGRQPSSRRRPARRLGMSGAVLRMIP